MLEAYRMKKMSEEVVGILDAQKVGKVLAVAHDLWVSIPVAWKKELMWIWLVAGPSWCLGSQTTSPSDSSALHSWT